MNTDLTSAEGFERLVREHQRSVFGTLTRLTGAGAHVEDLAQEVFLRLYRALPEFRGAAAISTYLYRIIVNVAQDEWKRRRRFRDRFSAEPAFEDSEDAGAWLENQAGDPLLGDHNRTPEQVFSAAETQAAVEDALLSLGETERTVLVLYHQEECTYEGIAEALGMPVNTVRTHLHRGRKHMAVLVAERLARPKSAAAPLGAAERPRGIAAKAGVQ